MAGAEGDPPRRAPGRARRLRDALGFAELQLGVVEGNVAAERVYARCGFVRVGEPIDRSAAGLAPEVRMRLAL